MSTTNSQHYVGRRKRTKLAVTAGLWKQATANDIEIACSMLISLHKKFRLESINQHL